MAAIGINQAMMNTFNKELTALMDKHVLKANVIKRKIAFDILREIVRRSPVDTGRYRANWILSLRSPTQEDATQEEFAFGKTFLTKNAVGDGLNVIAKALPGDDIWFNNNVPYAERLEEGHSKQAPAGIVGPVIERYINMLNAEVGV